MIVLFSHGYQIQLSLHLPRLRRPLVHCGTGLCWRTFSLQVERRKSIANSIRVDIVGAQGLLRHIDTPFNQTVPCSLAERRGEARCREYAAEGTLGAEARHMQRSSIGDLQSLCAKIRCCPCRLLIAADLSGIGFRSRPASSTATGVAAVL